MIKLFTHIDLDGVGCAVLAKIAFKKNVEIQYCNYDNIDQNILDYYEYNNKYDMCHITDISVTSDTANYMTYAYSGKYVLLDHHATALALNKYEWCNVVVKMNGIKTCGTELYYKWLVSNKFIKRSDVLDKFVETVRNYDTWKWAELGEKGVICKKINDLFYIYGRDTFIEWCILEIRDAVFPTLYDKDELVLNIKQKEIESYIATKSKHLLIVNLCGKKCGIVFADKYASELGNRLCQENEEIDFAAIIDLDGTVSYRTVKDNIDLANDVARLYGGGGHRKAAGSLIREEIQKKIVKLIFTEKEMG